MSQLFDIKKINVGPKYLTCRIVFAEDAPLMTDDMPEATQLVIDKLPDLVGHTCLGDGGNTFGEVLESTSIAHLFEHTTIELMARTGMAGDITSGKTRAALDAERAYDVRLLCPDDVLTVGALSSAAFILDWAYTGGGEPEPGIDAIVEGLQELVISVSEPEEEQIVPAEETLFSNDEVEAEQQAAEQVDTEQVEGDEVEPVTDTADADATVMMTAAELAEAEAVAEEAPEKPAEQAVPAEVSRREPGSVSVIAPPVETKFEEAEPEPQTEIEQTTETAEAEAEAATIDEAAEELSEADAPAAEDAEAEAQVVESETEDAEAEAQDVEAEQSAEHKDTAPKPIFTAGPKKQL